MSEGRRFVVELDGVELSGPLRGELISIGRDPGQDIVLADPEASRQHAALVWQADHWRLRDNGSTNGTFLDAVRLEQAEPVAVGQQVTIGTHRLCFRRLPPGSGRATVTRNEFTGLVVELDRGVVAFEVDGKSVETAFPEQRMRLLATLLRAGRATDGSWNWVELEDQVALIGGRASYADRALRVEALRARLQGDWVKARQQHVELAQLHAAAPDVAPDRVYEISYGRMRLSLLPQAAEVR